MRVAASNYILTKLFARRAELPDAVAHVMAKLIFRELLESAM